MATKILCKGKENSVELIFWLPGVMESFISISCNFMQNASTSYLSFGTLLSLLGLLLTALAGDGFVLWQSLF